MKNVALAVLTALLFVPVVTAAKPSPKSDPYAEVRARADAFLAAWNQHDSKAMSAFWAPDGDLINIYGKSAKGPEAVADNLAGEHATDMRLATMTTATLGVRILDPSTALVDWDVDLTGVVNPDASSAPSVKEHWTILMHRKAGIWWFAAARVASFVTAAPVVR